LSTSGCTLIVTTTESDLRHHAAGTSVLKVPPHERWPARGAMNWTLPHERLAIDTIEVFGSQLRLGELTAARLTDMFLERIHALDRAGPNLKSVIELNPAAYDSAEKLDQEQKRGRLRGPLHGIPVLIKDNIETADAMMTTAGSLAMVGSPAPADSPLVSHLRQAGAVILGKTNLSEWANFRSSHSLSGWSGRGRQTLNPYVLDRSPSGSSSGSAVAVAAGLCAVAVGTETSGSIISPSSLNGIVGFKPTLGRVSQAGIIPIAASQDTAGPHARSVADTWALYRCIAGIGADLSLEPGSLRGRRIGVVRENFTGYSDHTDRIFEEGLAALRFCGAELVDPVTVRGDAELRTTGAAMTLLLHEFKSGLNEYLASRSGIAVRTLSDVIKFNQEHPAEEMPLFGQDLLIRAEATAGTATPSYVEAKAALTKLARTTGIDAALAENRLDALVVPSEAPAFLIDAVNGDHSLGNSAQLAAVAGYPHITVPAGFALGELPVGLSLFGLPERELDLLQMAFAFEQATLVRRPPRYLPTLVLA
jgi:amidase